MLQCGKWVRGVGWVVCANYQPGAEPDPDTMQSMLDNGYTFTREGKPWTPPKPLRKRSGKTENAASAQQVRLF